MYLYYYAYWSLIINIIKLLQVYRNYLLRYSTLLLAIVVVMFVCVHVHVSMGLVLSLSLSLSCVPRELVPLPSAS